ncbi:MAG: hypothetical protein KGI78_03630 [Patescibacteria group bacterium]|nr:hypothetical protein [Patescibacteria group bacterium]MDE1944227.1 hypothetical protein [Patescibacteria group bacterium]MDE2057917.1 hypothetical protein [Patescibacteria group bacterium]
MEEITLDDKKYVSSKRAAQITGYAKDYIGQLCREGYVEGRRVGRSWYVLESAIKDHRFGATPTASAVPTGESPRYEALSAPAITLAPKVAEAPQWGGPTEVPQNEAPIALHETWESWFDAFRMPEPVEHSAPDARFQDENEQMAEESASDSYAEAPEDGQDEVSVPIRFFSQKDQEDEPRQEPIERAYRPYEGALSHQTPVVAPRMPAPAAIVVKPRGVGGVRIAVAALALVLALSAVGVAAIGSGYFDGSITSLQQASVISGVMIYNK